MAPGNSESSLVLLFPANCDWISDYISPAFQEETSSSHFLKAFLRFLFMCGSKLIPNHSEPTEGVHSPYFMLSSPLEEGFPLCGGQTLLSHLLPWACRSQSCSTLAWLLLHSPSVFFNHSLCNVYYSEKTTFWWSVKPFWAFFQKAWLPVSMSSQPATELSERQKHKYFILMLWIAQRLLTLSTKSLPQFPCVRISLTSSHELWLGLIPEMRQKLQGGGTVLSPTQDFVAPL